MTSIEEPPKVSWRLGVLNGLILGLLVAAIYGFNYSVDPYDLNRQIDLGLEKRELSYKLSNFAWNYADYLSDPKPVLVLGDSRARRLPASLFEESLGRPTFNMGFVRALMRARPKGILHFTADAILTP